MQCHLVNESVLICFLSILYDTFLIRFDEQSYDYEVEVYAFRYNINLIYKLNYLYKSQK